MSGSARGLIRSIQPPASSTDNAFARFDGATGKKVKNSQTTEDASGNVTMASIVAAVSDLDKFLVSDSGQIKFRTGTEVLADIGAAASAHLHPGDTLQIAGINSTTGAFPITVTGDITITGGNLGVGKIPEVNSAPYPFLVGGAGSQFAVIQSTNSLDTGLLMFSGAGGITNVGGFSYDSTAGITGFAGIGGAILVKLKDANTGIGLFGNYVPIFPLDVASGRNGYIRVGDLLQAGEWTGIQLGWGNWAGDGNAYHKSIIAFRADDGWERGAFHFFLDGGADASNAGLAESRFAFHYNATMGIGTYTFPASMTNGICIVN
ncbi:MAG: hypothetical protein ABIJ26_03775, partial [Candidatus Margulisiibacteriota bacterium]